MFLKTFLSILIGSSLFSSSKSGNSFESLQFKVNDEVVVYILSFESINSYILIN